MPAPQNLTLDKIIIQLFSLTIPYVVSTTTTNHEQVTKELHKSEMSVSRIILYPNADVAGVTRYFGTRV